MLTSRSTAAPHFYWVSVWSSRRVTSGRSGRGGWKPACRRLPLDRRLGEVEPLVNGGCRLRISLVVGSEREAGVGKSGANRDRRPAPPHAVQRFRLLLRYFQRLSPRILATSRNPTNRRRAVSVQLLVTAAHFATHHLCGRPLRRTGRRAPRFGAAKPTMPPNNERQRNRRQRPSFSWLA